MKEIVMAQHHAINITKHLLTASALTLALALSPAAYAHDESKNMPMTQSSPHAAKAPYDIQYLDTMVEH
ncbi:hypothetical protein ACO1MN_15580, partial [Staphylococcus aureus]